MLCCCWSWETTCPLGTFSPLPYTRLPVSSHSAFRGETWSWVGWIILWASLLLLGERKWDWKAPVGSFFPQLDSPASAPSSPWDLPHAACAPLGSSLAHSQLRLGVAPHPMQAVQVLSVSRDLH